MTLTIVASGAFAEVRMTQSLHKQFVALEKAGKRDAKRRLENHMRFYAKDGPKYLSDAKFKANEGRHPLGLRSGRHALVQAFADVSAGIRIYGCREVVDGKTLFICTEMDENKKKQKADSTKLARAATCAGQELNAMGVVK